MKSRILGLAALFALAMSPAMAQASASTQAPKISLLTFAPGPIYWQSYGHNALLVRTADAPPLVFNYGIFDFGQKNFFLNFARGRMQYRLAVEPLNLALEYYAAENRWVREQQLNLTQQQADELFAYLKWNALPENAEYHYDYFIANCSTRVRDALDRVLKGTLQRQLERQSADRSYRDESVRHMAGVPGLMLGVDAVLGPRADVPMTLWQQSFLPITLMQSVADFKLADGTALVSREQSLLSGGEAPVLEHAPELLFAMLGIGLVLGALLLLMRGYVFNALAISLSLISGIGGVILLLVWTATDHWAMGANHNLLLFSPLSWLLLPASAGHTGKYSFALAASIALGALIALALLLLPLAQQHLHWIALWLPVHLAMAWKLRHHVRPV